VTLDPARRFLLVPDMGADRIFVYGYDGETAALEPADPPFSQLPAGAGPRLVLFGADGRFAYLLTELSAEIFVFRWDEAAGRLDAVGSTALDGQTVPETRSAAAFAMSKDGRFLYASNRRTAMIHVYSIAPMSGLLSERQQISAGGDRPWCAELSPDERWMVVANQASNTIRSFGVDLDSGLLTEAGSAEIPIPTGVAFFPEAVVGALPMAPALQGVI
jgi:6-phosphogluconolactonase